MTFLRDMAGCMRAKATRELLDEEKLDFFAYLATGGGLGSRERGSDNAGARGESAA